MFYDSTVKVEPTSLIKIDKDVTGTDKAKKNLILIGNENNNLVIKDLCDSEISKVVWSRSFGQWEYLRDIFYENSVLIVGGKNSESTNKALEDIMKLLFV